MEDIRDNNNLKIAIPNKGRLLEPSLKLLEDTGLIFQKNDRSLISPCQNFDLDIVYIRAGDIPEYVQDNVVDLGITGSDLILEKGVKVEKLINLGFGKSTLVVAVPYNNKIKKLSDLKNKKIATTYISTAKEFLKKNSIKAEIIEIEGATEITTRLSLSDAIIDVVSSGTTLRMNNLKKLVDILDSEAVLIGNKKHIAPIKRDRMGKLVTIIDSVVNARNKRYIMMNVPEEKLEKIKKVAPGLSSPTVMKLVKKGMIAVHSVVNEKDVWEIINKLKKIGATGILVMPIEKITF